MRVCGEGSGGGQLRPQGILVKERFLSPTHTLSLCPLSLTCQLCPTAPQLGPGAEALEGDIMARSPWPRHSVTLGEGTVSLAINYAEHGGRAGMGHRWEEVSRRRGYMYTYG